MHYYSHHIADFNNATRHLTRTERSIYIELLWLYYDKEDPLPDDPSLLARLILAPGEEDSIKQILEEFFIDLGQGYINARCDVEIAKYHAKADRAIRANKKRWGSKKDLKSDADQIPTNNQQPITNNQRETTSSENAARSSPVPYQKIVDLYHEHCPQFPKVIKLSTKRKKHMSARWKDEADNLEFWMNYFKHAATSKFLGGNNDRAWTADIDFLISERAMIGMQEGKYHHG